MFGLMQNLKLILFAVVPLLVSGTRVQKCDGDEKSNVENQVFITGCVEPPCKFQKNTTATIEFAFQPDYDISRISTSVYAWVYAIPFPYLGIDETTACDDIFYPDGQKATCPVRKGKKYIYRNTIDVKPAYPKVKVTLHWALIDARNKANIYCFEVPVKITS